MNKQIRCITFDQLNVINGSTHSDIVSILCLRTAHSYYYNPWMRLRNTFSHHCHSVSWYGVSRSSGQGQGRRSKQACLYVVFAFDWKANLITTATVAVVVTLSWSKSTLRVLFSMCVSTIPPFFVRCFQPSHRITHTIFTTSYSVYNEISAELRERCL